MARASEPAVRWRDFLDVPRHCAVCNRTLKLEDVGEYRTTWSTGQTVIWCVNHRGGRK